MMNGKVRLNFMFIKNMEWELLCKLAKLVRFGAK